MKNKCPLMGVDLHKNEQFYLKRDLNALKESFDPGQLRRRTGAETICYK